MTEGTGTSVDGVSQEVSRRLQAVGRAVSPEEIGDLWIFPPLRDVEHSAEFLLFTRRLEEGKLRLYSARLRHGTDDRSGENGAAPVENGNGHGGGNGDGRHVDGSYRADGAGPEMRQEITEHGSVPADRVQGLVVRFRRRLGDEGEPRHVSIDGREDRWRELFDRRENGSGPVEAAEGGS